MVASSQDANESRFTSTLNLARKGDASALDELATHMYPTVQAEVHRKLSMDLRVGRPWLASRLSTGDIVQDVFSSVIRDVKAFSGETEEAFRGYLAMVIRNRILDSIRFHEAARRDGRRRRSLEGNVDEVGPAKQPDPMENAIMEESNTLVWKAMADLDEKDQLLVRARMEGSTSFAELAEQLGYGSESSARRAFFEAQAFLALRLRELNDLTRGDQPK
jgi:RNA polymerase sigma factor (sigma-70 family)